MISPTVNPINNKLTTHERVHLAHKGLQLLRSLSVCLYDLLDVADAGVNALLVHILPFLFVHLNNFLEEAARSVAIRLEKLIDVRGIGAT